MKFIFSILPIVAILVASCGSDSNPDDQAENNKESETSNCEIAAMTFQMGNDVRTLEFYYENNALSRIETIENGVNKNSTMAYNFDEKGMLQSFLSGSVIAKYVYDDLGKIVTIKGERGMSNRIYEYDDYGRISAQHTEIGGRRYLTHKYEYDAKNQPTKVSIFNEDGELTEVNEVSYDNKINPFKNKGTFVNSMEMLLGYPVGNQDHNIIGIKKIHKKESTYTVNGEYMKPGEIENNKIEYKYNKAGYPVELSRIRNGRNTVMKIDYNCN